MRRRMRRNSTLAVLAVCGSVAAMAGCGSSNSDYANNPRPPAPITITAAIGRGEISVSPAHFGAGPVSLIVVNETAASQQVTLESDELDKKGLRQQTGPINPSETATLKADVPEGRYVVHVDGDAIKGATLRVGPQRASAQNDLLQP